MFFLDLQDAGMGEMVVVAMTDHDNIYCGYVGEMTGSFCISFRAQPRKGRATVFEDWIEQYAETAREFDIVTGMSQPSCTQ